MHSNLPRLAWLAAALLSGTATAHAQDAAPMTSTVSDPYQWLEDVTGDKPLAWVKQQNAKTEAELGDAPGFEKLEADVRAILDSDAKIPFVNKIGDHYYNFWQDAQHERGLWRRTTLAEYRKPRPAWETVIDLDALGKAENEKWVWHGADCLRPDYTRCLVALSRGGSDADVTREFDLASKSWVKDGFERAEAKGDLSWIDRDTVYVATDFGEGSMTESGYPRIVKQWTRGTPLSAATVVYEARPGDMMASAGHDDTPGYERDLVRRVLAFYADELFLRNADGTLTKVDVPDSAQKTVQREWLGLELRDPWTVGGKTYTAGSFIVANFDAFMAGKRDFDVLFEPTQHTSLAGVTMTKSQLVLNVLDDVKNRLYVARHDRSAWTQTPLDSGAPEFGTTTISAVDADDSDQVWMTVTDYLTPTTLLLADPGKPGAAETLKTMPTFFDASKDVIEQRFAVSQDGTKVPYFLVRPKDLKLDGTAPTLLYGYGGFEISLTPSYSGVVGKAWLEKGGVYAVANIRGGGEYGPRWHQAALKENRHKAYEDFAAVARDLADSKITSAPHLAAQGGSNGGLLAGNMLTQYPQLFGAVVIQVPLLDMKRYSHLLAGASWMAEYGDPDSADWNYIKTFSPYQLFDAGKDYPATFIWTTTKDDRVHPAHARKMAAKMLAADKDVRYFENTEGGHGAGATNAQTAHVWALNYSFLWKELDK